MRKVGALMHRGFMITVDYGYPAVELYAPFRRNGTLMCYHRHAACEDPYLRFGAQDITAHVDFTSLQRAGEEAGLQPLYFGEQYRFLMGLGFMESLMRLEAKETDKNKALALRMTLKNLILPDGGMGGVFKVLIQGKGVDRPRLWCSRSIAEISRDMA
jgi:SAM-dependent MidA family methyltransferase